MMIGLLKTCCLIGVSTCFSLDCYGQQNLVHGGATDSTYSNQHYEQRLAFFKKMPDRKGEIIFLGNSLTEGGRWPELFQRHKHVLNRGISGDVTYGVLARMDEVLASKPKKILLLIGVNDMKRGTSNAEIVRMIGRIVLRAKKESPNTKFIIQGLLPVNEQMLPTAYQHINNEKINALNGILKERSTQWACQFVDLHPAFVDAHREMRKELVIDGLHLRQASYIVWADYLKKLQVL